MSILTGRAKLAGIIGWPVAHSRSPRIHNFWLERHGLDGAYVPLPVRPEDFSRALDGVRACGFAGLNVTLPHKLAAFAACDSTDDLAARAGAVNTLVFREGRVHGMNTDGTGFLQALREGGIDPGAGPALVLGAGGAARAVVAALSLQSVPILIANRTRERAEALARDFPGVTVIDWERRSAAVSDAALLVNTTSLGMQGHPALDISLDGASERLAVADAVYVPLETGLLRAAGARGLRCADGLAMLLHQAGAGFAAWFGVAPVVDQELRDFVLADLVPR